MVDRAGADRGRKIAQAGGWSALERAKLRAVYPLLGTPGARAVLGSRTDKSIRLQAEKLGLRGGSPGWFDGRPCPKRCAQALARLIAAVNDPDAVLPDFTALRQKRKAARRRPEKVPVMAPVVAGPQASPEPVVAAPVHMAAGDAGAGDAVRARVMPPRKRLSFEQQLEAVRNGASLERVWRAPSAADARTLGGVASGWGM